jgi:hypothetical protein
MGSPRTAPAAMKCSVCGSESNADARFCSTCGANLHPEADTLFRVPNPHAAPVVVAPPAAPADGATGRVPRAAGWLLLVTAVIVIGYVVYRQLLPIPAAEDGGGARSSAVPVAPPAAAPAPQTPKFEAAPIPAASPAPSAPEPSAPVAKAPAAAPRTAAPKKGAKSSAGKHPAPPPPAPPVAAAPPPRPAPAPVAVEPPRPDRLQQLNGALGRCKGRDLIARAVCEQRARLQYCDGYWDQVPQCSGIGKLNPAAN